MSGSWWIEPSRNTAPSRGDRGLHRQFALGCEARVFRLWPGPEGPASCGPQWRSARGGGALRRRAPVDRDVGLQEAAVASLRAVLQRALEIEEHRGAQPEEDHREAGAQHDVAVVDDGEDGGEGGESDPDADERPQGGEV